jgi:hypothetical protein
VVFAVARPTMSVLRVSTKRRTSIRPVFITTYKSYQHTAMSGKEARIRTRCTKEGETNIIQDLRGHEHAADVQERAEHAEDGDEEVANGEPFGCEY